MSGLKAKVHTSFIGVKVPGLTKTERIILDLYRQGHTAEQIRILRRQKSVRAIQLHLQNIRRKGVRPENLRQTDPGHEGCEGNEGSIRLHGEQFVLRPLFRDERYARRLKKANTIYVDGSTVRLHQDTVEVYSCKSFYASDADKADIRAAEYWARFFIKLESDLDVILVKDRSENIKRVAAHYERVDSELGGAAVEQGRQIKVYAADGKLRFVTDRSNFGKNDETLHPQLGKPDRKTIDRHVQVMLEGAPDLLQLRDALVLIAESNAQTAAGVAAITTYLAAQLPKEPSNVQDKPDFSELRRWC